MLSLFEEHLCAAPHGGSSLVVDCPYCHADIPVLLVWDAVTGDIEHVLEPLWLHCRECGYEEELAEE